MTISTAAGPRLRFVPMYDGELIRTNSSKLRMLRSSRVWLCLKVLSVPRKAGVTSSHDYFARASTPITNKHGHRYSLVHCSAISIVLGFNSKPNKANTRKAEKEKAKTRDLRLGLILRRPSGRRQTHEDLCRIITAIKSVTILKSWDGKETYIIHCNPVNVPIMIIRTNRPFHKPLNPMSP